MSDYDETTKQNQQAYLDVVQKLDPELYMIKIALMETDLNPLILPKIIRSIGNLCIGTGYGKIQIFMQARVVTQIKGEESVEVNQEAVIEKT